jgi:hypothetical protein
MILIFLEIFKELFEYLVFFPADLSAVALAKADPADLHRLKAYTDRYKL